MFIEGTPIYKKILLFLSTAFFIGVSISTLNRDLLIGGLIPFLKALSIALSSFLLYVSYKYRAKIMPIGESGLKRYARAIVFVTFVPAITYLYVVKGVASFLHAIYPKRPAEIVFTVDYKQSIYRHKGCRGGFSIKESQSILGNKICSENLSLWKDIEKGDKVIVEGVISPFVFEYTHVTKLTSCSSSLQPKKARPPRDNLHCVSAAP